MGNQIGVVRSPYDVAMDQAKAECEFTDKLYEILLAWQNGRSPTGQRLRDIPPGNIGELSPAMSRLYNQIWSAVMGLQEKAKQKKNSQQMGVIA